MESYCYTSKTGDYEDPPKILEDIQITEDMVKKDNSNMAKKILIWSSKFKRKQIRGHAAVHIFKQSKGLPFGNVWAKFLFWDCPIHPTSIYDSHNNS